MRLSRSPTPLAVGALSALLLLVGETSRSDATPAARAFTAAHRDVLYTFMPPRDPALARRQSLDLYLPAVTGKAPPLVAFVHGGFWTESDDRYGVGPALAQALVPQGVAVALIRYRLAPSHRFPENAEDVARALAFLHGAAAKYGYDASRIYLAGHSTGAHLASLVALDEKYQRAVALPARALAGVIALSGIYDLTAAGPLAPRDAELIAPAFGRNETARVSASPVTHARRAAPMLILSAENDFPGFQADARRFAARLRAAGLANVQEILIQKADHLTIVDLRGERNLVRAIVLNFIGLKPLPEVPDALLRARRLWQEPPFSTEPFWTQPELIQSYPVDGRFREALRRVYDYNEWELKSYPLKTYQAMELFQFLAAQPVQQVGTGEYLVLTNTRGGKMFWKRSRIEPYRPVIVVGLDDERNLFRLTVFYQHKLEYSWRSAVPRMAARSVGAFIHFLEPPPTELQPPTTAMFSLTKEGFRLAADDPLAAMADLPKDVYDTMNHVNACFSCHSFRGTDVRAGHVAAFTGKPQGGFALALESYPPSVWRQFMFENDKSAAMVGVRGNAVEGPVARKLYDLVVAERERGQSK